MHLNNSIEYLEIRRLLTAAVADSITPSLDSRWQQADIGAPLSPGSATSTQAKNNIAVTLASSDLGVTTTADLLHFVYEPLWGNGRITAHLVGETGSTDPSAEAGIMIRESLDPGARTVSVSLNAATASLFSDRLLTDDPAAPTGIATTKTSPWLRIVRTGNTFTTFISSNQNNWKRVSVVQIPMVVNAVMGLWVSSNDPAQIETATLDHVQTATQKPNTKLPGWQAVAPAPITLYESASASVNGKLYVFGGFYNPATQATAQSDVYDPATNIWSPIAPLPYVVTHPGVAVVGTDVYLAGGFLGDWVGAANTDQTNGVLKYDTLTNTWSNIALLPASRAAGGLVAIGNQLHFFGGTDEFVQNDMADQWMFDLTNPSAGWVAEAPMPTARDHFGYTVANGLIYAIGGEHLTDEIQGNIAEVDAYNPVTNTWQTLAPLPIPLSHVHTNTLVFNNKIAIFGGSTNGTTEATILNSIYVYNPKRNRWTLQKLTLPEPRSATVVRQVGNQIIITGGENNLIPQTTTWEMDATVFTRQLQG